MTTGELRRKTADLRSGAHQIGALFRSAFGENRKMTEREKGQALARISVMRDDLDVVERALLGAEAEKDEAAVPA